MWRAPAGVGAESTDLLSNMDGPKRLTRDTCHFDFGFDGARQQSNQRGPVKSKARNDHIWKLFYYLQSCRKFVEIA